MGRLVLQMGVSIDGFVAAADGSHPSRGDLGEELAQLKRETANDLIAYPTGTAIHVYRPRPAA